MIDVGLSKSDSILDLLCLAFNRGQSCPMFLLPMVCWQSLVLPVTGWLFPVSSDHYSLYGSVSVRDSLSNFHTPFISTSRVGLGARSI